MHSFKIIKADETGELSAFSFGELDDCSRMYRDGGAEGVLDRDGAPVPDPLVELEETIRQRLLEVERTAQEIESEAYEKGYDQGLKDGTEYGRKTMEVTKEHMERLLSHMEGLPREVLSHYRDWLIEASITISKQIVQEELSIRPELIAGLLSSVIGHAEETHSITVYLHPKDLELVSKHTDLENIFHQSERTLSLKPDPEVAKGGCRLETDIQLIDASLESRFALLKETLSNA